MAALGNWGQEETRDEMSDFCRHVACGGAESLAVLENQVRWERTRSDSMQLIH